MHHFGAFLFNLPNVLVVEIACMAGEITGEGRSNPVKGYVNTALILRVLAEGGKSSAWQSITCLRHCIHAVIVFY
jgi:hypothetical protein